MARKHDEANVIRSLNKKSEIKVDTITGCIEVLKEAQSVGIRSWGKIDFLVNHCGYHQIFVKRIAKGRPVIVNDAEDKASINITKDTKKILKMKKL